MSENQRIEFMSSSESEGSSESSWSLLSKFGGSDEEVANSKMKMGKWVQKGLDDEDQDCDDVSIVDQSEMFGDLPRFGRLFDSFATKNSHWPSNWLRSWSEKALKIPHQNNIYLIVFFLLCITILFSLILDTNSKHANPHTDFYTIFEKKQVNDTFWTRKMGQYCEKHPINPHHSSKPTKRIIDQVHSYNFARFETSHLRNRLKNANFQHNLAVVEIRLKTLREMLHSERAKSSRLLAIQMNSNRQLEMAIYNKDKAENQLKITRKHLMKVHQTLAKCRESVDDQDDRNSSKIIDRFIDQFLPSSNLNSTLSTYFSMVGQVGLTKSVTEFRMHWDQIRRTFTRLQSVATESLRDLDVFPRRYLDSKQVTCDFRGNNMSDRTTPLLPSSPDKPPTIPSLQANLETQISTLDPNSRSWSIDRLSSYVILGNCYFSDWRKNQLIDSRVVDEDDCSPIEQAQCPVLRPCSSGELLINDLPEQLDRHSDPDRFRYKAKRILPRHRTSIVRKNRFPDF